MLVFLFLCSTTVFFAAEQPVIPSNQLSLKEMDHKSFIEKLKKFTKERKKNLLKMIEKQIGSRVVFQTALLTGSPMPKWGENDPYLIESTGDSYKLRVNQSYRDLYHKLLGMQENKRLHSGNYGGTYEIGMFKSFVEENQKYQFTASQKEFLLKAYQRFRDNSRSTTKEEMSKGELVEEKGKITRGFVAIELLLKNRDTCNKILTTKPTMLKLAFAIQFVSDDHSESTPSPRSTNLSPTIAPISSPRKSLEKERSGSTTPVASPRKKTLFKNELCEQIAQSSTYHLSETTEISKSSDSSIRERSLSLDKTVKLKSHYRQRSKSVGNLLGK